jgi:DNA mismatch endonuclease (patch repair protein)
VADVSSEGRRRIMQSIRAKDTQPELAVRRLVRELGFHYRLHRKGLPGRPDICIARLKAVVFVHGCFWHQHAHCGTGKVPQSNRGYWLKKLRRNIERDAEARRELRRLGWKVMTIWECQVDRANVKRRLSSFLLEAEFLRKL